MRFFTLIISLCLLGCESDVAENSRKSTLENLRNIGRGYTEEREPCSHYSEERIPLFGDLHVHTSLSFDAAANTIGATPRDAHDFAKGKPSPPLNLTKC